MEYRRDLINFFIEKFSYERYLEIGVARQTKTFDFIKCAHKEGVDPNGCTTHKMKSDDFFAQLSPDTKWDIIFVDGFHERSQVKRDIENALKHLKDNGTIVCHDVNPRSQNLLDTHLCWNAWEAFAELRSTRDDLEMHGVTFDHCGFIRKGSQNVFDKPIEYTWQFLNTNRKELFNEITTDELISMF